MTENIADILSRWETESTALLNETKYQTVRKNVAPVQAGTGFAAWRPADDCWCWAQNV